MQARTSRSTRRAGARPVDARVVDGRAWAPGVTPSAGCGCGRRRAVLDRRRGWRPAARRRLRRAGRAGRRWCRCGRIVSVTTPKTGPVSRPSSSRKVVAPVTSSPCQHRVLHRGGAAPGRQQREVQVDPAVRAGCRAPRAARARRRRRPGSSRARARRSRARKSGSRG